MNDFIIQTQKLMGFFSLRGAPFATTLLMLMLVESNASARSLEEVEVTKLDANQVEVSMILSEPLSKAPSIFTIDKPARIAIDLHETNILLKEKTIPLNTSQTENIIAVEAVDRTRVVINMLELVPYSLSTESNRVNLILNLSNPSINQRPNQVEAHPGQTIKNIDFRTDKSRNAKIIVALSKANGSIDIKEQGAKLIVDLPHSKLPEHLDRKLDVADFATPVTSVDAFREGNGSRIIITSSGSYEHLAYQSDNILTIEVREVSNKENSRAQTQETEYTGERLSLNFQNISVRSVLQLIADFTDKNLVASDSVSGNITLRLKNVPWDQALDIILKARGLGKRETNNIMMIAPQDEIANRERVELESQQQLLELSPLKTEFIQINYAKASEISNLVKDDSNNLLSERGNITVDERTNTLLVQDTVDKITEIRSLISVLDIPIKQVLIESRIVVANDDFSRELGVRFGYSHNSNSGSATLDASGKGGFNSYIGGGLPGDTPFPGTTSFHTEGSENYLVDLSVAGATGDLRYAVGRIGSYLLQLQLSALQAEGRGEVISSPRVITANQKEAVIESGTEVPYLEASSSGATSISFKKAVLSLKVTPQITPDNKIIMDLSVNQDSVGQIFSGIPSIDTNELTTQVLVDNGDTIVLGGIYETANRNDRASVPFFGDIPYLGRLFNRTQKSSTKQELLVFITPRIITETLSSAR